MVNECTATRNILPYFPIAMAPDRLWYEYNLLRQHQPSPAAKVAAKAVPDRCTCTQTQRRNNITCSSGHLHRIKISKMESSTDNCTHINLELERIRKHIIKQDIKWQ